MKTGNSGIPSVSTPDNNAIYAMAMDLLGILSRAENEEEAITNLIEMLQMLFAPTRIHISHPKLKGRPDYPIVLYR